MNTGVKSKKTIVAIVVVTLVALFVVVFAFKSDTLASDEVFNDIDFTSGNANIDGYKIDFEKEDDEILTKIQPSDEEKIRILKALEQSKFEKLEKASTTDADYRINITLNKRYELYLNSTNKILIFAYENDNDSNNTYYKFSNDNGFFKLLEASINKPVNK